MRFRWLLILLLLPAVVAAQPKARPGTVCLERAEITRLRTVIANAKKKILLLRAQMQHERAAQLLACDARAQVWRVEKETYQRQIRRLSRPCTCTVPWVITGVVAGACVAGIGIREVTR